MAVARGDRLVRIVLLTALTMVAFAANSVLNRAALVDGTTGPAAFAAVRFVSGAVALFVIAHLRGGIRLRSPGRWIGVLSLALYVLGFSFAYVSLDTGLGALILFGGVQITMFAGALIAGERIAPLRWLGAVTALSGLGVLCWPEGASAPDPVGVLLMAAAAVGWGIYSLHGRGSTDPLGGTAANFVLAAPLGLVVFALLPDALSLRGAVLGLVSGVITSGLGYALWYSVLPRLQATMAAVAQLTVPVIAFLGEAVTGRFLVATALVIGGILVSVISARAR